MTPPIAVGMAVGVALTLLGALCFAWLLGTKPVGVVRVAGDLDVAEREQVEAAVGRELARPRPAGAEAVASAVGALAWVRAAQVRRQWPDTLVVEVARETLAAHWDGGWLTTSGSFVADRRRHAMRSLPNLPTFDTVHADGREAMRVFGIVNAAASVGGLAVAGLEEDVAEGWTVVLAGGGGFEDRLRLLVGREDLAARTLRFVHVYRQALRYAEPIALADARYDSGVAVRWRQPREPARPPANLFAVAGGSPRAAAAKGRD